MDTILVVVTGLSLAMAGGMGALLVRMLREERRRSDARVALLEQLSAGHGSTRPASPKPAAEAGVNTGHGPAQPALPTRAAKAGHGSTRSDLGQADQAAPSERPRRAAVSFNDLDLRPEPDPVLNREPWPIFHEHDEPSAWPRRFAVVGGLAVVLAAVLFGWSVMRPPSAVPAVKTAAHAGDLPLQLLSLQHAQRDGTLVITGLVQNPRGGVALVRVQATVQLFGPDGGALASGRAPLDFTRLSPGDESPFVIRVPVSSTVARYRVGFRGESDRVLDHVDRRNADALARKQAP